jgi:large subunit ribosomal protein L25
MAKTSIEFTAFPRDGEGRGASRRLRHSGKTPGIDNGGVYKPASIELDHNALIHALKNEAFHSSILTMQLGKGSQRVLLRDVQMHPYRPQVLHIDFQRIDENKKIHMKVPLHFVNAEVSPAVKLGGAIISHVLNELDIACLPKHLPEFIQVDLSTIEIGHSIKVSDLKLTDGVVAVTHGKDPVVASAVVPKVAAEAEETAAAEAEALVTTAAAAPAADSKTEGKAGDAKSGDKKDDKKDDKKK